MGVALVRGPRPLTQGSCTTAVPVDRSSGMNAAPHERGLALLLAHCASLDPDSPTARERLDEALGPDLAQKLVFALSSGTKSRARSRSALGARALFAA
jgi:hypothetical protein